MNSSIFLFFTQGKTFPTDQMPGSTLKIQSLSYEDGGQYECIADNGIGAPASASVTIDVHCAYCLSSVLFIQLQIILFRLLSFLSNNFC